ncbi:hypothetical protein FRC06_004204, partial [Ceratobasidium sp. 370]
MNLLVMRFDQRKYIRVIEIEAFADLAPLVPRSVSIKAPRYGCVYTLRCEIENVAAAADDEAAFPDWTKARMAEMGERQAQGDVLEEYLDIMEDARELEIDDLKMQRKDEIETRLLENGWTKRDMMPSPQNSAQWQKLVWQPKPITDRVWTNLYPKLVPLLGSNRTYNEAVDKAKRRRDR